MKPISFVHKRHRFIKLLHDTKSSLKLYMNRTQDVLNIIDEDIDDNESGHREQQTYNIQGISGLDYLDLYRKFTYGVKERYTLDHISWVELGEKKAGNPYDTFREWYQKDYQSFIEYNINDVELVDKLEDKLRLIELC